MVSDKSVVQYESLDSERITESDVACINELLQQLTASPKLMVREHIAEVANHSVWMVVRDAIMHIMGMATLTISHLPTGKVGHVDDVVVHRDLRGKSIGEELMKRLIVKARFEFGVDRLELTSHPNRVAANALYKKLGFQLRETNCYTLKF